MSNIKVLIISILTFLVGAIGGFTFAYKSIEQVLTEPAVLQSAVVIRAKQLEEKAELLNLRAGKVGLTCGMLAEVNCEKLIVRAENNPQLKAILLQTKAQKVNILVSRRVSDPASVGRVEDGYISLNVMSSDEEIIEYLEEE